jgi:hypothetical protein
MKTEWQKQSWAVEHRTLETEKAWSQSTSLAGSRQDSSGCTRRAHHCPACHSIVYSRRQKLCGVCGEQLPPDTLFSPREAQAIDRLLSLEKQRYRQWLSKGFSQALAILV